MNSNKICFIMCVSNQDILNENISYINRLVIPDGFEIDLLTVEEVDSMASGYNEMQKASDAKYKIYLHQDTFICNTEFLVEMINLFKQNEQIGAVGVIGGENFLSNTVTSPEEVYGEVISLNTRDKIIPKKYVVTKKPKSEIKNNYVEVGTIWGCLFATQVDFEWDEIVENDWKYYAEAHSFKIRSNGYKLAVFKQEMPWSIHEGNCEGNFHNEITISKLMEKYGDLIDERLLKRVLFIHSTEIHNYSLPFSIYKLGFNLETYFENVECITYDESIVLRLEDWLKKNNYLCILTYDFSQTIAEAAYRAGVKYLAVVWDSPLMTLYTREAKYSTSYVYSFDSFEVDVLKKYGLPNIYYLPLSTNIFLNSGLIISKEDEKNYSHDIVFIGNLYNDEMIKNSELFFGQEKDKFDYYLKDSNCNWEDNIAYCDEINSSLMEAYYKQKYVLKDKEYKRAYFESKVMRNIAHIERIKILNKLAEKYNVDLYTQKGNQSELINVIIHGPVNGDIEAPKIFHLSKINLNITLHCIRTGAPLRIFDIMSVGGFVLSNYQKDLADLFEDGKEIVMFKTLDEMMEKIDYYLKHEKERVQIAMNGYKKAKSLYSHEKALSKMLELAEIKY